MLILPRVSAWGWPEGLVRNLQIPQQVFNEIQDFYVQDAFSSIGVLKPHFKSSKGIGRTSLSHGVLTRFAIKIFFLRFAQCKKTKKSLLTSYLRGQLLTYPQPRIPFFWFTSSGFCKRPVSFEVLAPASLFLKGSHMQREYRKRTTLRSKSSTSKGLLYAHDPDNREKGTLSDQPWLLHVSSTVLLCCWGGSRSKIWRPLWLTLRRIPYGRGTLRIPLQSICSKESPHYRHEQSARKLS